MFSKLGSLIWSPETRYVTIYWVLSSSRPPKSMVSASPSTREVEFISTIWSVITEQETVSTGISAGISVAGTCVISEGSGKLEVSAGSPNRVAQASEDARIAEMAKIIFMCGMIYPCKVLARIPLKKSCS